MKVTPRPSGQPSCLTDVETKIQKAEGPCFCSHSMQAGLEPRIPISYHCGIKRLCGSAGAGLFLTQASRWVAEEWVPRTLGSLWGKEEGPGARCQLWCLWAHTRGRPVDLCLEPVSPGLERHLKRLCALKTSIPSPSCDLQSTTITSPLCICRVPVASNCLWGWSHVQVFVPIHQLMGFTGNRERIDTEVRVRGQVEEWMAQEGREKGDGRRAVQPRLQGHTGAGGTAQVG